ncbi:MAG: ferrous iron transport protein A [Flavobacteriales bacterium]|jgi:ferrous iron transport protein A|nr:ferrous iron transport protein A [Flavobacteriales bacterium]
MDLKRLSDLEASQRGKLTRIDAPEGMLALMEMGCVVGEDIEVRHIAPLGDPMAVTTGGNVVTLRKEQAELMWVEPIS